MRITFLGSVPFGSMVQRPALLARAFARAGHSVTYVSSDRSESGRMMDGVTVTHIVPHENDVIWCSSGYAFSVIGRVRWKHIVYDVLDDEQIFGVGALASALVRGRASVVFVVSEPLLEKYPEAVLLPNAVDLDWAGSLTPNECRLPGAVYAGTIPAPWVDSSPIYALAERGVRVIIAGKSLPQYGELSPHERIDLLGEVEFARLPEVLQRYRVGLIPFTDSAISRHADPLKLYQYLACGLSVLLPPWIPVLSDILTSGQVCRAYPSAWPDAFQELVQRHDPEAARTAVKRHTWDARVQQALDVFRKAGIA